MWFTTRITWFMTSVHHLLFKTAQCSSKSIPSHPHVATQSPPTQQEHANRNKNNAVWLYLLGGLSFPQLWTFSANNQSPNLREKQLFIQDLEISAVTSVSPCGPNATNHDRNTYIHNSFHIYRSYCGTSTYVNTAVPWVLIKCTLTGNQNPNPLWKSCT